MDTTWLNDLEKAVDEAWEELHIPVLFSQVPSMLAEKGVNLKAALSGVSLKNAILVAQSENLRAIQNPADSKIWALVPKSANVTPDEAFLALSESKTKANNSGTKVPEYFRGVFTAFVIPLEKESGRRYLNLRRRETRFFDLEDDDTPKESWVELPSEYIRAPDEKLTVLEISDRIEGWIKKFGIPEEEVKVSDRNFGETFDLRRLGDLEEADQSRISIPLDIVIKLFKQ